MASSAERSRPRLNTMSFPDSPVHENLFHRTAEVVLDVVVVGGSIAGLSAAYNFKQAGHNVRVLEKSDGELKAFAATRVPPNLAKLLQHWGIGAQLREKAMQCPKIDFLDGPTGEHQTSLIYHKELMKELQADMYGMLYADLYEMIRGLVTCSGVKIDYNTTVLDVDVDEPSVLLEGGEKIHADLVVGADGTEGITREKVVNSKETQTIGSFHLYSYLVPVKKLQQDPLLQPLVKDGTWTLWLGNLSCTICFLASPEQYSVCLICPNTTGKRGWTETSPLSQLDSDFSGYEERLQRLISLGDQAIETQHVVQSPLEEWYSENGKVVLVGNTVHVTNPGGTNETALAVEDGAVLGSLFSRLQSKDSDEILRLLNAYQEIRQDRCTTTLQSDIELVTFCSLPPGPACDERNAGFKVAAKQEALDWENVGEDLLSGAWEEFRGSFGYEAYDAADDWWVDWGIMAQRMAAAQRAADEAYVDEEDDEEEYMSRPQTGIRSSILEGLQTETVVTTIES